MFCTVLVTHRVVENQITHVFCLVSGPLGGYKTNSTLIQIFHLANFHVDGIFYQMHKGLLYNSCISDPFAYVQYISTSDNLIFKK